MNTWAHRVILVIVFMTVQGCATGPASRAVSAPASDALTEAHRASEQSNPARQALLDTLKKADLSYGSQQWESAAALYQQVLTHMPDDAYLWFRLGNSLTRQGKYSQAIYAFETSLQHDGQQTKPWFNLSTSFLLGAQVATLRAWETASADDPSRRIVKRRLDALMELMP